MTAPHFVVRSHDVHLNSKAMIAPVFLHSIQSLLNSCEERVTWLNTLTHTFLTYTLKSTVYLEGCKVTYTQQVIADEGMIHTDPTMRCSL